MCLSFSLFYSGHAVRPVQREYESIDSVVICCLLFLQDADLLDGCDANELSDLEDDFDDDRFLAAYRDKRLQELKAKEHAMKILPPGHGEPLFIKRDEFIKHVTEAEKGTWVIVHLFKDG